MKETTGPLDKSTQDIKMKKKIKIKMNRTETKSFGTTSRRNHDSSKFYNSKLYNEMKTQKNEMMQEQALPLACRNKIFCKSSEHMTELPDNSIHLMITSPPYNVGKDYDQDLSLKEYLKLMENVLKETYRVLAPGGRACINIANIGRKPYIPLHSYFIEIMLRIGFLMRGEIIWDKSMSAGSSTAWGSWKSAKNPSLRDVHEYVLIFSKSDYSLPKSDLHKDSISRDDFLNHTKSIWSFSTASARKIGHPAPFPEELPKRLIELYSYEGSSVLDPFMGSGQTALAAIKLNRIFVGYDIDKKYCELANKRINAELSQKKLI